LDLISYSTRLCLAVFISTTSCCLSTGTTIRLARAQAFSRAYSHLKATSLPCNKRVIPGRSVGWLLFPGFPGAKKEYPGTPHDNRPQGVKQVVPSASPSIRHGINKEYSPFTHAPVVDDQLGLERRLPSCTHPSNLSQVPSLCCEQPTLRVSGSSVWDIHSTMAIHHDNPSSLGLGPRSRCPTSRISRRFPFRRTVMDNNGISSAPPLSSVRPLGVPGTSNQVGTSAMPGGSISGGGLRHTGSSCQATGRSLTRDLHMDTPSIAIPPIVPPEVDVLTREAHVSSGSYLPRSSSSSIVPVLDKFSPSSSSGVFHQCTGVRPVRSPLVAAAPACGSGGALDLSTTRRPPVHRCLQGRVGGSLSQPSVERPLVTRTASVAHKSVGVARSLPRRPSMEGFVAQEDNSISDRQLHCGRVCEQAGRDTLNRHDDLNATVVHPGRCLGNTDPGASYSGEIEYPRQLPVPLQFDSAIGMVVTPGQFSAPMPSLGDTTDRPLRDVMQCEVASLHQPRSRTNGTRDRCTVISLDKFDSIRLPSMDASSTSTQQDYTGAVPCVSGGASLDNKVMVPKAIGFTGGPASSSRANSTPSVPAPLGQISPEPAQSPSTRLETISNTLSEAGFSRTVSEVVVRSTRSSTSQLYNARWLRFRTWRSGSGLLDQPITVPMVADFLHYLRTEFNLRGATLDGYKSAIASSCDLAGIQISGNEILGKLLRSYSLDDVRRPRTVPKWSLPMVLDILRKPPFEPVALAPLPMLSRKTAFLLALASASRVSELHALDFSSLTHAPDWSSVTIRPLLEFVAKNQRSSMGPLGQRFIRIPALTPHLPSETKTALLCPIRALRAYLDRTAPHRDGRKRLVFVL